VGSLVLIPWPETVWSAAGRVAGRTPLPLTDDGRLRVTSWCGSLASQGLSLVYSSTEKTAEEVARLVAERCGARLKLDVGLAEVDAGLWTGLSYEELKRRDAKLFKRWVENPASVCPPEGEDLANASDRLDASLRRALRKLGDRHVAVVLGPLAFPALRCRIESTDLAQLRSLIGDEPLCYDLEADADGQVVAIGPPATVIAAREVCAALPSVSRGGQGA